MGSKERLDQGQSNIEERLSETRNALADSGIKLPEEMWKQIKEGLEAKQKPKVTLDSLKEAGKAFEQIKLFLGLPEGATAFSSRMAGKNGSLKVPYFSEKDLKLINAIGSIKKMGELDGYTRLLPVYQRKAQSIDNHFKTDWHVESPFGLSEMDPLTSAELQNVHDMSAKKGTEWLEANLTRVKELQKAVSSGLIAEKSTYDRLRITLSPEAALTEIKKLTGDVREEKESASLAADRQALADIERQLG